MPSKKLLSQFASLVALSSVINSNSVVERTMHMYLDDFQEMTTLLNVNIYPLVDLVVVLLKIELTLLYPFRIGG